LEWMGTGVHREGRRWVLDHRRSLYNVKLTNDEVLALYLAARLLSRHSDEHNPHVVMALAKLADAVRNRSPIVARHIDQAAATVRERHARPEYIEALEVLTRGWVEGRKVRLSYWSFSKRETTERTFAPYYLEPSAIGYACHAIGYDELRAQIRTLKVERIRQATLTDERFAAPPEIDVRQWLASAWGIIWSEEDEVEVGLRFAARVVPRLKESTWHHSQRIEELPDGSCVLTVRVGSTLELKPWVRQFRGMLAEYVPVVPHA
jgi:predicted DNA-binding transcriptional regulator YafY